jgi:hypothetical protein
MRRRIELWALAGFLVAVAWVILSLAVSISQHSVLWLLARLTCPIVPISMAFYFGVKWYWVIASNVISYALIRLIVEGPLLLLHRHQVTAHNWR